MKFEKMVNKVNAFINKQMVKFYIKKGGHWNEATRKDLLFLSKREFSNVWPKKRGDLLQTNTWEGYLLAIFIANVNNKDVRYTIDQLNKAERMAPAWLRENSNME